MTNSHVRSSTGTRAVGYLRRSTDRQEQSIPDQKRAVEQYAAARGLSLLHFYTDDAISGTSTVGRRAFQQMIADAGRADRAWSTIVVYDVKRFGRVDNDEAGYYRHLLRGHGVAVAYASENFSGDGTDDLLRPVKQWQAREESKDLSKVTIRGLLSKVEGGWWMGGVPPLGYDLRYESGEGTFLFVLRHMPDGTKELFDDKGVLVRTLGRRESLTISKRDRAKLVPSTPERVAVVRDIFRLYVEENRGFKAIADHLNRTGVPTPRGPAWAAIYSGKWTDTTIRAILVNPIYAGSMVWNRRTDGRFHKIEDKRATPRERMHASRLQPNEESEWIILPDTHPSLVPPAVFLQARKFRETKPTAAEQANPAVRPQGNWNGMRSRFVLSGLLTCARCGNRYQGVTRQKGKARLDGTRPKNFYYGCGGHITKGNSTCEMGAVPQEKLESAVVGAVLGHYRPFLEPGGRKKLAEAVARQLGSQSQDLKAAAARLKARQGELTRTINNLLDNITEGNRAFVDQRLKELQAERKKLQVQEEQLQVLHLGERQTAAVVEDAFRFLSSLEFTLREGVPEEKRAALRRVLASVVVDTGKATARVRTLPTTGDGPDTTSALAIPL